MKPHELVILSGKGGTGKTSVSAALAAWFRGAVLTDTDVDGANLELVLQARKLAEGPFAGRDKARIKPALCTACGRCADVCRFDAVNTSTIHDNGGLIMEIDQDFCEGCGLCAQVCPAGAIAMHPCEGGTWRHSSTPWGELYHAALAPGGENSGKLVALLRKEARARAEETGTPLLITDGPPGSGCPVIATLTGAQQVLLVTEPTPSGLSDLQRVAALCRHFHRPMQLVINKHDLSPVSSDRIEQWAATEQIPVIGRLPFDPVVPAAIRKGVPVTTLPATPWRAAFAAVTTALALPQPQPTSSQATTNS